MKSVIKLFLLFNLFVVRPLSGQFVVGVLDTVELTTNRIPTKLNETGRFVTILTAKQISNQATLSVDELFRYLPGVEVQSRNAFGAQSDIIMRGSTFTQVLVLVDGMRLTDPLTAHFNGYIPIPTSEIYRIEVLRGPAAASFGPDAVGGVINIVTKTFAQSNSNEGLEGEINFNYGEEALVNAQAGVSWSNGKKTRVSLSGAINDSEGQIFPAQTVVTPTDTNTLNAYNAFFDIKNVTLGLAVPISSNWDLKWRMAYDYRDFNARYFYTTSPFDLSVETTTNWWNHLQLMNSTNNGYTKVDLAYKRNTDEFIFNPAFTGNNHTTQLTNFQLNHFRISSDEFKWNAGLQVDQRRIESNDRGNHQDTHIGGFVSGAWSFGKNWRIQSNLRLDQDDNYGLELSPQINASFVTTKYVIRSTIGRSIRAADFTERYVSNNLPSLTPGRNLGNPRLNAESSWSSEIGVDLLPSSSIRLAATTFLRISDQLIDYIPTNSNEIFNNENLTPNEDYFYASNIEDVTTFGIELEAVYEKVISNTLRIFGRLGYTFVDTQNESGVTSVYISNHARHLVTTHLNLGIKDFDLSLNGLWKQRNERLATQINQTLEQQYSVWHLKLQYQVSPIWGINFQVHNLFDQEYQDILGAPMPSRWLMGGINLKW